MRIATLILSIVLMFIVGAQFLAVSFGDALMNEPSATQGGVIGVLIALLFLVGAAFALGVPAVSFIVFSIAGIIGLAAGASTSFADLTIWGVVSFVLAAMSFFGLWGKRRQKKAVGKVVADNRPWQETQGPGRA